MSKVAFFVQWMLCGGVENALISLTNRLVEQNHDVTIYVIEQKGEFINKISSSVVLRKIPMDEKIRRSIPVGGTRVRIRECVAQKKMILAMEFAIRHKLNRQPYAEWNVNMDKIPQLDDEYDIAVNFHMHSPFLVWYLSERVNAKKKYTWIHNDFSTTQYDLEPLKPYLKCIDHYFAVAENLRRELAERLPEARERMTVALNIVPRQSILEKGDEFYPDEFKHAEWKGLKILTVGRLEEQKGYDIAIDVCERLKKSGAVFQWFVLGEGTLRRQLENEIKRRNLEDCFHLLGVCMNPYPYFKNCDIYVQTSRHEGYVTTVTEAKIFNRPIVCTDVSGAKEQLVDGQNGNIVGINAADVFEKLSL